jgi:hypothetical protein
MKKQRLELTTELVGMSGLFCSYHGYANPEHILNEDMIGSDFEEGETDIHPDYYWRHFDNVKYMEKINERTHEYMSEFLSDLLKSKFNIPIEYFAEGYNAPREYNFRGDRHNFDIEADTFQPVLDYCLQHKDFEKFLKDRYSSRSGFISFTSNNVTELLLDIEANQMTAWGAVFSFVIVQERDVKGLNWDVLDVLSKDMCYTEFVDYKPLDNFLKELRSKRLDITIVENDWQKALFERELGSIGLIKELSYSMYKEHSLEEITNELMGRLGMDTDDHKRPIIENSVKSVFNEIESHNLKLEL